MAQKKIAILISGENRLNFLSNDLNNNIQIENYNKYIFTNEFKEKYDYDVFISTDNINFQNAKNYFGENNLKNIHLTTLENDIYYMNNIHKYIKSFDYYRNFYFFYDHKDYKRFDKVVYEHYRLYDLYNLLDNYSSIENYDYIIRFRIDVFFNYNLDIYLERLNNNNDIHIFAEVNIFTIGRSLVSKKILQIVSLEKLYNKHLYNIYYNFSLNSESIVEPEFFYCNNVEHQKRYSYCAELQFVECLFEYCVENNLDIDKAIKSFTSINEQRICKVHIFDNINNNYYIKQW